MLGRASSNSDQETPIKNTDQLSRPYLSAHPDVHTSSQSFGLDPSLVLVPSDPVVTKSILLVPQSTYNVSHLGVRRGRVGSSLVQLPPADLLDALGGLLVHR